MTVKSRARTLVFGCAIVCTLSLVRAQTGSTPAQAPSGIVLGRVVDAMTNQGIGGALVTLGQQAWSPSDRRDPPKQVISDPQGRFVFRTVARGVYALTASVSGNGYSPSGFIISGSGQPIGAYLPGGYGQLRPDGPLRMIELGDAGQAPDAEIRLWKGASVDGVVVDEAGEPVVAQYVAAVRRSSDGQLLTGPTARTDDRGQYHLGTLAPGEYLIVVPQTQLLTPLEIAANLAIGGADPMLLRAMSSGGRPNAVGIAAGSSKIATATGSATRSTPINMLEPRLNDGALWVYRTTFHPSATTAGQATAVRLAAGEERTNINVALRPTLAAEISGMLTDDAGPVGNFGLHLMPVDDGDGSSVLEVSSTTTDPQGAFVFPLVPTGSYVIRALRPPQLASRGQSAGEASRIADRAGAWAALPVSVGDRSVTGVAVRLQPGVRVTGHVRFRGSSDPPTPDRLRQLGMTLLPARPLFRTAAPSPAASPDASGTLTIQNVPHGDYVLRFGDVAPTWRLASMSVAGRDATDAAMVIEADVADLEIVFTDRPAGVSGIVRNDSLLPDPTVSVIVYPTNRQRWLHARESTRTFVISRTGADGAYSIPAIPPGEYFAAAVPDVAAGDWPDRKFLERVAPVATTIRITEGQSQKVDLKTLKTLVLR